MKKIILIIAFFSVKVCFGQNHTVHNNATSVTILPSSIESNHISNSGLNSTNFSLGKDALKSDLNGKQNTAIGISALQNLNGVVTTSNGVTYRFGDYNTAIGYQALMSNVHAGGNVAVGSGALKNHLGGFIGASTNRVAADYGNVAVGTASMLNSTGGLGNVAIGNLALANNKGSGSPSWSTSAFDYKGSENVAIGLQSTYNNTTGRYNIAIGSNSLYKNTYTSKNVAIGHQALYSLIDAGFPPPPFTPEPPPIDAGNVAIGFQAGYNELGLGKLYIENSNSSTPLIGGDFANDIVGINKAIADLINNPTDKLQVGGNVKVDGGIRANLTILTSNQILSPTDYRVLFTGTTTYTVTLPTASTSNIGKEYIIVNQGNTHLLTSPAYRVNYTVTSSTVPVSSIIHLISDGIEWRKINN